MTRIRLARDDDAIAIARIQIASWRAAYRAIMPADFLAGLSETERADRWRTRLGASAAPASPTYVALGEADTVVGFAHTGPPRDEDLPSDGRGELYTLYVDPSAWRRGIGAALLAAIDDFWRPTAVRELLLWVFEDNTPARAFYERCGWRADGACKLDDFNGVKAWEIRYRRALDRPVGRGRSRPAQ